MVECDLAKVEVAGSNPVSRSNLDLGASPPDPLLAYELAASPARSSREARFTAFARFLRHAAASLHCVRSLLTACGCLASLRSLASYGDAAASLHCAFARFLRQMRLPRFTAFARGLTRAAHRDSLRLARSRPEA